MIRECAVKARLVVLFVMEDSEKLVAMKIKQNAQLGKGSLT